MASSNQDNGSAQDKGNKQSGEGGSQGNTKNRGFASMDPARQREIASEGGKAAHQKGTAHEFTSEEARRAGSMSHGNRQSAETGGRSSASSAVPGGQSGGGNAASTGGSRGGGKHQGGGEGSKQ